MRLFFVILVSVAQINNPAKQAEDYRQKGIEFKNIGQLDSSLYYLGEAKAKFFSIQDTMGIANVLVNIASVESIRGNYLESFRLYQDALTSYQNLNAVRGIVKVYINLGNQQLKLNNLNDAYASYKRAEQYSVDSNLNKYLSYIYNGLGSILINNDFEDRDLNEAEAYFNLALKLFEDAGDIRQASFIYNNLAIIFSERGNFSDAIDAYQRYISLGQEEGNQSYLLKGYHNLSNLYKELGDYELSLENLLKAEEIALATSDPINYIHILSNLVDVNMSLGNLEQAQSYLNKYKTLRDSIYDEDKIASLNELQVKYRTKEKEELLAKEIELSTERKRHNVYLASLMIVLIIAFGVIIWLLKKRRIQELARKQKELEFESLKASMQGEERERQRLASDLHDSVGGVLTAVRMIHTSYKGQVGEQGKKVDQLLQQAANTVREVSHNLSSNTLERHGLKKSIEQATRAVPDQIQINYSVNVPDKLTMEMKKSIDYIVKELLNNTIKHAEANHIDLELNMFEDTLLLTYEDDGHGVDLTQHKEGLGLNSISDRIKVLRGNVEFESAIGQGFVCTIEIPL